MLNKLFGKGKNIRVSSQTMEEKAVMRPIPFRTRYGGCRPGDYQETSKMQKIYEMAVSDVQKLIDQGLTDQYSEPQMFDKLVDAYFQMAKNEVEKQSDIFLHVIESIQEVAECALLRNRREALLLESSIQSLDDEIRKEGGEHYAEIKEK